MEDIIDIIVTETTNLIEITSQPTDEIIDVNIIDNREDVTLNVTPTVVEININSLTSNFGVAWGDITGTLADQTDLQNVLNAKADLVDGKVPSSQLPSYVDDVVEVANYASLPATGEVGKIYITLDTNYIYRWTGSTYVEIKDSSAVWGAITGTLSNQTDLQNALNLKANDSLVVHLAGTETITGAKTFSSAVTAPNFVLSGGTGNTGLYYGHTDRVVLANYTVGGIDFEVNGGSIVATLFPSGNYGLGITLDAGYKLDVNGTARISGVLSGTSASFSSSVTASSIIKSGGTSSQFLKADGSVDSTSYQPLLTNPVTGTGTSGIVAVFNGTSSITDSTIYANSTRVSIGADVTTTNRFTAVSSTTSAYAVVAQASSAAHGIWSNVLGTGEIFRGQTAGGSYFIINNGGNAFLNGNLNVGDFASTSYRLNVVGTANFTGALSGTSATFSALTVENNQNGSTWVVSKNTNTGAGAAAGFLMTNNTGDLGAISLLSSGNSPANGLFIRTLSTNSLILGTNSTANLTIASGGAATFSSSVTATQMSINTTSTYTRLQVSGGHASVQSDSTAGTDGAGDVRRAGFGFRHASADLISALINTTAVADWGLNLHFNTRQFNAVMPATPAMTITAGQNVGIGTTSPASKLHIEGTGTGAWLTINRTDSGTNLIDYTQSGTRLGYIGYIGSELWINNATASDISIRTSGSERMRITSSGNVGIGTTAPTSLLDVKSTSPAISINSTNTSNASTLLFKYSDAYVAEINAVAGSGQMNFNIGPIAGWGGYMSFKTDTTERMRITSGGKLLIGTTSAGYGLFTEQRVTINPTNDGIVVAPLSQNYSAYTVQGNNDTGTRYAMYIANGSGSVVGSISFTSVMTSYNVTSDYRLKEDLKPINGLDIVNKIKVYDYKWKADNSRMDGVLAHELQEVLPYAVSGVKDGEQMQSVDYSKIVPVMVQAIKDLKAELDTLKNK